MKFFNHSSFTLTEHKISLRTRNKTCSLVSRETNPEQRPFTQLKLDTQLGRRYEQTRTLFDRPSVSCRGVRYETSLRHETRGNQRVTWLGHVIPGNGWVTFSFVFPIKAVSTLIFVVNWKRGEDRGRWDLKRSEISWAAGMKLWQHLANVGINIYLRGSEKYLSRITGFFFSFILLRINIYGGCEKYLFRIIGFFFFFYYYFKLLGINICENIQ